MVQFIFVVSPSFAKVRLRIRPDSAAGSKLQCQWACRTTVGYLRCCLNFSVPRALRATCGVLLAFTALFEEVFEGRWHEGPESILRLVSRSNLQIMFLQINVSFTDKGHANNDTIVDTVIVDMWV